VNIFRKLSCFCLIAMGGCTAATTSVSPVQLVPSSAVLPFSARSAAAATYHRLFAFQSGQKTGSIPNATVTYSRGTLYGTTSGGGLPGGAYGLGTVYELDVSGLDERIVYKFRGGVDGNSPASGLIELGGLLYGVTPAGGAPGKSGTGHGTFYSVDPATGKEKVLYRFQGGSDADTPESSLVYVHGRLYGTSLFGGGSSQCALGCGTVFAVTPGGSEHIVYAFKNGSDGDEPMGPLTFANNKLYGVTYSGGGGKKCAKYVVCAGTVYSVTESGIERVVYRFDKATGTNPDGPLSNVDNVFYGVASSEGAHNQGTFYSVSPSGTFKLLHAFKGGDKDGAFPNNVTYFNGAFYGTTTVGGGGSGPACFINPANDEGGCGTIFKVTPAGNELVLKTFQDVSEGAVPVGLTPVGNILYGTTESGGNSMNDFYSGTVFKLTP
jgi:uncharacterized repeat protein (TIGR03803 family)